LQSARLRCAAPGGLQDKEGGYLSNQVWYITWGQNRAKKKGTVGSNMTYQVTVQAISWPEAEEMK